MHYVLVQKKLTQSWKHILRSFQMCPGFILQPFISKSITIDASLDRIVLAQLIDVNVIDGELMIYSEPSHMAFILKVYKFMQVL